MRLDVLRRRKAGNGMRLAGRFAATMAAMVAVQLYGAVSAVAFHEDPPLDPVPPFVLCDHHRYGLCFTSTTNKTFPGFPGKLHKEIICSCPITTEATPGSPNTFGYQVFGSYHPQAPVGQRCDPSGCAKCSVSNPTANGSIIPVGA